MAQEVASENLTNNQWGGWRHRQCIDLFFKNNLHLSLHALTRRNRAITAVDATKCFNNILYNLKFITYHKAGAPLLVLEILRKALLRCQYHVVVSFGTVKKLIRTHNQINSTDQARDCQTVHPPKT